MVHWVRSPAVTNGVCFAHFLPRPTLFRAAECGVCVRSCTSSLIFFLFVWRRNFTQCSNHGAHTKMTTRGSTCGTATEVSAAVPAVPAAKASSSATKRGQKKKGKRSASRSGSRGGKKKKGSNCKKQLTEEEELPKMRKSKKRRKGNAALRRCVVSFTSRTALRSPLPPFDVCPNLPRALRKVWSGTV